MAPSGISPGHFRSRMKNHLGRTTMRVWGRYDTSNIQNYTGPVGEYIPADTFGKVEWLSAPNPGGQQFLFRRHDKWNPAVFVDTAAIEVSSAVYGLWDNRLNFPEVTRITPATSEQTTATDFDSGMARKFFHLMTNLKVNTTFIPPLTSRYDFAFKDKDTRKSTTTALLDGMERAAADLVHIQNRNYDSRMRSQVAKGRLERFFAKPDFTIDDFDTTFPFLGSSNFPGNGLIQDHDAVCYIIIYRKFKKDSRFYGWIMYYFGQANDAYRRHTEHRAQVNLKPGDPGFDDHFHYQVSREAGEWVAYKLFSQGPNPQLRYADRMRDIFEQSSILLFAGYRKTLLQTIITNQRRGGAHPKISLISDDYAFNQQASMLTAIAEQSFKTTGFASPFSNICKQKNGTPFAGNKFQGLNVASPLFAVSSQRDQVVYTLRYSPKTDPNTSGRYIFHRHARICYPRDTSKGTADFFNPFKRDYTDRWGNFKRFEINTTITNNTPQAGDEYWTVWEFMEDGVHPAPYFRVAEVGYWSNWIWTLKIGFKIIWKSKADGKLYQIYLQNDGEMKFNHRDRQGAQESFCRAMGLFAYFFRTDWPNRQDFIQRFGQANVVKVDTDFWRQKNSCTTVVGNVGSLPAMEPKLEVAAYLMRSAGLQNVNGPFGSLDGSWMNGIDWSNVHPGTKKWVQGRHECDRCWLTKNSDTTRSADSINEGKCERMNANGFRDRCTGCFLAGVPCSWTPTNELAGINIIFSLWSHNEGVPGRRPGRRLAGISDEVEGLLFKRERNVALNQKQEISDPRFLTISGEESGLG